MPGHRSTVKHIALFLSQLFTDLENFIFVTKLFHDIKKNQRFKCNRKMFSKPLSSRSLNAMSDGASATKDNSLLHYFFVVVVCGILIFGRLSWPPDGGFVAIY